MPEIKCVGRRTILVEKSGDKISLAIIWKGTNRLATLQLEKLEAIKLIGELNASIGFERNNSSQK